MLVSNHVFYILMRLISTRHPRVRGDFIHASFYRIERSESYQEAKVAGLLVQALKLVHPAVKLLHRDSRTNTKVFLPPCR